MDHPTFTAINTLRKSHYWSRYHLELQLETAPRESRYSSALMDLMRKEELDRTSSVSARVDEALRAGKFN